MPDIEEITDIIFGDKWFYSNNREHARILAKEICQLFPKTEDNPNGYEPEPDKKLLTPEEILAIPYTGAILPTAGLFAKPIPLEDCHWW